MLNDSRFPADLAAIPLPSSTKQPRHPGFQPAIGKIERLVHEQGPKAAIGFAYESICGLEKLHSLVEFGRPEGTERLDAAGMEMADLCEMIEWLAGRSFELMTSLH